MNKDDASGRLALWDVLRCTVKYRTIREEENYGCRFQKSAKTRKEN